MTSNDSGIVKWIKCCDKNYKVVDTIYKTQSFIGCATRVWQVVYKGKHFILKDTWVKKSHPFTEIQHLQHIAGVPGVPVFVCGEDVTIDGKVLCTGNIRGVRLTTMCVQ